MERLAAHRSFFADLVTATVGIRAPESRLRAALAATPRERFVGQGPWRVFTAAGYIETPTDDPAFLYQDITVALRPEGQIQPKESPGTSAPPQSSPGGAPQPVRQLRKRSPSMRWKCSSLPVTTARSCSSAVAAIRRSPSEINCPRRHRTPYISAALSTTSSVTG